MLSWSQIDRTVSFTIGASHKEHSGRTVALQLSSTKSSSLHHPARLMPNESRNGLHAFFHGHIFPPRLLFSARSSCSSRTSPTASISHHLLKVAHLAALADLTGHRFETHRPTGERQSLDPIDIFALRCTRFPLILTCRRRRGSSSRHSSGCVRKVPLSPRDGSLSLQGF